MMKQANMNSPIARTVTDAVYVLDTTVGKGENDPGTLSLNASTHILVGGYAQYLKSDGLNGNTSSDSFNFPEDSIENRTSQQLFQLMR